MDRSFTFEVVNLVMVFGTLAAIVIAVGTSALIAVEVASRIV